MTLYSNTLRSSTISTLIAGFAKVVEFINFLNSFGLKVLCLDSLASWANASLPVQLVHLASLVHLVSLVRLVQLNLLASLT